MAKAGRKYEYNRKKVHKKNLAIAVSQEERDLIEEAADKMGISMSAYVRYKLFYENKE